MDFSELFTTIMSSFPGEWYWMFTLGEELGGHRSQLTYLPDVSISLRWGLEDPHSNLEGEIAECFTDLKGEPIYDLDICHNGVPVVRAGYIELDLARCMFPVPHKANNNGFVLPYKKLQLFDWVNRFREPEYQFLKVLEKYKITESTMDHWPFRKY